ncbi:hypothetical protein Clacol_001826 [Clathrus columnatus]|uniref:Casein kinase II subunit beta n=1 Tax=Clathrus columnatus TaxID=1419009 RepID=A0AAV4ZZ52_9AGAM|nr:hypothetical protein Clacol_001826 [Clathrus columnatus]
MQQELTLRDYETRLALSEELSSINNKLKTQVDEQGSTIQKLNIAIGSNEATISELRISLLIFQKKWTGSESLLAQTKEELATSLKKAALSTEAEMRMQAHCHQIMTEKDALLTQIRGMEQRVATFKEKEIIATETASQLKVIPNMWWSSYALICFQSLQEQFENQALTLRLEREANADLHERLLSATSEHTKILEESKGAFQKDVAILQERNISLHTLLEREKDSVNELRAQLVQKETEILTYLGDNKQHFETMYHGLRRDFADLQEQKNLLETQMDEANTTYQAQYSEFQIKEDAYLREIKELGTKLELQARNELGMIEHHKQEHSERQKQVESLQSRLADMEKNVTEFPCNHFDQEQEIQRLREHICQIQSEHEVAKNRIITLSERYDEGNLDQVERNFVQKLMKGIQTVHDQEIAKLKNELHRKDGLIFNLQDIRSKLENSLKKKIQVKGRAYTFYIANSEIGKKKTPVASKPTFETSEFINWPSSPSIYLVPSPHPCQHKDEVTMMPADHGREIQASPQQSNIQLSPFNAVVVDITARLQDSNERLEVNTGVLPVQSIMKDTGTGTSSETQRVPKRPRTGGRNTERNIMPRPIPQAAEPPVVPEQEEEVQEMEEEAVDREAEGYGEYVIRMCDAWPSVVDTWVARVFERMETAALLSKAQSITRWRESVGLIALSHLASSTPTSSLTWITWFCSLPGHEYFAEVSEDFIEDDFNLTGLNSLVPFWKEAMEMVLDVEPEDSLKIPDVSIVETSAELLYGLVHQRYILTRAGLGAMAEKYENGQFGSCPRVFCSGQSVVPCGRSDLPGLDTVKLYCPNCNDIYTPPSSRFQGVDAPAPYFNGPTSTAPWSHGNSPVGTPSGANNNQSFVNTNPYGGQKEPFGKVYVPRIYGFRVSERARSGPRMQWIRLRPQMAAELDMVDWRGRWIGGDEYSDGEEDDIIEDGQMEDFDPVRSVLIRI